jgi:hypothetical protein
MKQTLVHIYAGGLFVGTVEIELERFLGLPKTLAKEKFFLLSADFSTVRTVSEAVLRDLLIPPVEHTALHADNPD